MTSIKNKAWVQNFSFLCQRTAEKSSFNRFGCLGSTPTQTRPGGLTRPKSTPYIWNGHIPKIKPIAQCLLFVLMNNHPGAIVDQVLYKQQLTVLLTGAKFVYIFKQQLTMPIVCLHVHTIDRHATAMFN